MKLKTIVVSLLYLSLLPSVAVGQEEKPRIIVMTDGEVDDRCSMVRFLLYTNEFDVKAIIETSSIFQRQGWSKEKWLQKEIADYGKVWANLHTQDASYPTA